MSITILRHHDPAHALDHDPFRARNRNHLIRIRSMIKIRKRNGSGLPCGGVKANSCQ
jgi:hypothetical protein